MEAPRLVYKSTDWEEFTKHMENNYQVKIPNDRNLDTEEIGGSIAELVESIVNVINQKVPTAKISGNTEKYTTKNLQKLEKRKSALLTTLNRRLKNEPQSRTPETKATKLLLAHTKEELKLEFSRCIEKHWTNVVKKINYRDSGKFMPKVNRIFQPKPRQGLTDIHIPENNNVILTNSGNDLSNTQLPTAPQ